MLIEFSYISISTFKKLNVPMFIPNSITTFLISKDNSLAMVKEKHRNEDDIIENSTFNDINVVK